MHTAEQESRNHNHYYIGAEHLLVALLEERDPAVMQRLERDGIDIGEVHAAVRRALGTGEDRSWEGVLVTPRVKEIVRVAHDVSEGGDIEPLHLLEALRREGGSRAAHILLLAAPNTEQSERS